MEVEQSYPSNKFDIVLCELFNRHLHGFNEDSDPTVQGHYLVIHTSKNNSIYIHYNNENELLHSDDDTSSVDDNDIDYVNIHNMADTYRYEYTQLLNVLPSKICGPNKEHPIIRNYFNIVSDVNNYIKPEIAQKIYLSGDECVAILKTFWLRIIQRAWKRVYRQRQHIMQLRLLPASLFHRQTTGVWPHNCLIMPSLNGMLV